MSDDQLPPEVRALNSRIAQTVFGLLESEGADTFEKRFALLGNVAIAALSGCALSVPSADWLEFMERISTLARESAQMAVQERLQ